MTSTHSSGHSSRHRLRSQYHPAVQLLIIQLLVLFLLVGVSGNSDWMQSCGVCHCNWNSGMKTADCKNKSLTTIPTGLSNEMQVVDFSNNFIPELKRDHFLDADLANLHKLFMRNCTIQELNRDALNGLAILIELDMSHNYIRVLHPGIFSGLVKLRNLVMNNNQIEVLENNLFIDLNFLSRVEFKHNRVKRIEIHSFDHLPSLSTVYLESNQLTVLHKETFANTPKLAHLSLAQNPWNCTCDLQEFRVFAVTHRLYTPPTDCHEPEHLRGKLWSEIPADHFACRPHIVYPRPGHYIETNSENATIQCRIDGSPRPDVVWVYNKRPINMNDHRFQIRNSVEQNRIENSNILISELIIYGVRPTDRGWYSCIAENRGGKDETNMQLVVGIERFTGGAVPDGIPGSDNGFDSSSNFLLIICLVAITLLLLLIVIVLVICWYCRRIRTYQKDATMSENGLIGSKMEKSHNGSVLEGSVIMEMQKSLLTEVNPVEKPPRRTEVENMDMDDGHEIKKTLLDETQLGHRDEETHSVSLSDTTPRSRQTFVDDGYGTNLPPDLLAFPARVPASPSIQSSTSNIPQELIYGKSPLASPVYQHVTPHGIYGTTITPGGFMTLQHPKNRNLALVAAANSRNQSPFIPAPVYSPVVMKQGYMTIPRKPRVPSWTPSNATQLSEFQSPTSPIPSETGTTHSEPLEPVYDNLGLRTTAGGNSILNLHKINSEPVRYTMKDRPLPATPGLNQSQQQQQHMQQLHQQQQQQQAAAAAAAAAAQQSAVAAQAAKIYEPIQELVNNLTTTSDTEPLYGTARHHSGVTIVPSMAIANGSTGTTLTGSSSATAGGEKLTKVPPRPPPKPKKKMSVTSNGQGSTSQLFDDEGEDGTEV